MIKKIFFRSLNITALSVLSLCLLTACDGENKENEIIISEEIEIENDQEEEIIQENIWKEIETKYYTSKEDINVECISDNSTEKSGILKADGKNVKKTDSGIQNLFSCKTGDNVWVFTGGNVVSPGFREIGSKRNYISHFEEYIRWELASDESVGETEIKNARQRYTINAGAKGRSLSEIIDNWQDIISINQPKAIVYFLGKEDYMKGEDGLENFCKQFKKFLDLGLSEKNEECIIILQLPFYTGENNTDSNIEKYISGVFNVLKDTKNPFVTESDKYERIFIVNHYEQTKNREWVEECLSEGNLNAKGHLEIGYQLAESITMEGGAFYPSKREDTLFNSDVISQSYICQDGEYEAVYQNGKLNVVLKEEMVKEHGEEYYFEVETVTDTEEVTTLKNYVRLQKNNSFMIEGIKPGAYWLLQLQTGDRKIKFHSMEGEAIEDSKAEKHEPKIYTKRASEQQKKLADLLAAKDSVRWLFVGDSITHGNLVTHGHDNIAQLFEKYVKEELNRPEDVIINSAIWASTIGDYVKGDYAWVRLDWQADVVMIMLGTNDAGMSATRGEQVFKSNFYNLLRDVKKYNPNAIVVVRTPMYTEEEYRVTNLLPTLEYMKEISSMKESGETFTDFYIDQYTPSTRILAGFPWLYGNGDGKDLLYGDIIHPNELGHLLMFRQLIHELGLEYKDSPMLDFYYDKIKFEEKKVETKLDNYITYTDPGELVFDISKFVSDYPNMGNITLKVIDCDTGQRREKTAKRSVVIGKNPDTINVEWKEESRLSMDNLDLQKQYEIEIEGWSIQENKKLIYGQNSD